MSKTLKVVGAIVMVLGILVSLGNEATNDPMTIGRAATSVGLFVLGILFVAASKVFSGGGKQGLYTNTDYLKNPESRRKVKFPKQH